MAIVVYQSVSIILFLLRHFFLRFRIRLTSIFFRPSPLIDSERLAQLFDQAGVVEVSEVSHPSRFLALRHRCRPSARSYVDNIKFSYNSRCSYLVALIPFGTPCLK